MSVEDAAQIFLSTPSARRATFSISYENVWTKISIHALREEGDITVVASLVAWWEFLSTPSARRATLRAALGQTRRAISIHALREEGDQHIRRSDGQAERFLSTPSARRATRSLRCSWPWSRYFYPRPPRGGRPIIRPPIKLCSKAFLSTPSARRATAALGYGRDYGRNFYPRPPRGGRHLPNQWLRIGREISIHALREEGDRCRCTLCFCGRHFYPRPPRGGRQMLSR